MRITFLILAGLVALTMNSAARAETYNWCSNYGSEGGAVSCSFVTLEQCKAAVSGVGGFCRPNAVVETPSIAVSTQRKKKPL